MTFKKYCQQKAIVKDRPRIVQLLLKKKKSISIRTTTSARFMHFW